MTAPSILGDGHVQALEASARLLDVRGARVAAVERDRDRGPHRWMTRERQLLDDRPDAVPIARPGLRGGLHERGLGLAHPECHEAHPLVRDVIRVEDDRQQVAAPRRLREHLEQLERVGCHRRRIASGRPCGADLIRPSRSGPGGLALRGIPDAPHRGIRARAALPPAAALRCGRVLPSSPGAVLPGRRDHGVPVPAPAAPAAGQRARRRGHRHGVRRWGARRPRGVPHVGAPRGRSAGARAKRVRWRPSSRPPSGWSSSSPRVTRSWWARAWS